MPIKRWMKKTLVSLVLAGSTLAAGCTMPKPPEPEYEDKYAILISGSTNYRHKENLSLAYQVLLENGFDKGNIFILDTDGERGAFYPTDYDASRASVEDTIGFLSNYIDEKDLLFFYVTNHGGRTEAISKDGQAIEESTICLFDGDMPESELEILLSSLNYKKAVMVFDQCYSGGFAERMGYGNNICIAASDSDKSSWGNTFPQAFFKAWRDISADRNMDKRISIQEAFDYAVENDDYAKKGDNNPCIQTSLDPDKTFIDDK